MKWGQTEQPGWPWKKGSSHRTAAPGPSHHRCPVQRLQHQSKKVISKKRLFLVKLLGPLPMEKRGKEQEESGTNSLVVTKLNCPLCVNMGQYISRAMPRLTSCCAVCCVPHYPASTQEQNRSSSGTFFVFIFAPSFPVHPRKESSLSEDSF